MGRKVKLQDLNIYGNSDNAFKASNGKYYSSEEAWQIKQKENEYRLKCISHISELMGYEKNMKLPTTAFKFIAEYGQSYSYESLFNTMIAQDNFADWALKTKEFKSENNKVAYLFAIYRNNIMPEYKRLKKEKNRIREDKKETAVQFEDLENRKQKVNDISNFLDDDE